MELKDLLVAILPCKCTCISTNENNMTVLYSTKPATSIQNQHSCVSRPSTRTVHFPQNGCYCNLSNYCSLKMLCLNAL